MQRRKIVNISFFIILVLLIFLGFNFIGDNKFLVNLFSNKPAEEETQDLQVAEDLTKRQYPPGFTEEMKIVLVPQTDEVGKEEHREWDVTLREIAEDADLLRIYDYKEDCFGDPLVFRTKRGEEISVKNDTQRQMSFGFDEQMWEIAPGETIHIIPEFEIYPEFKLEENPYGYGCGGSFENAPSGLFLVR